MRKVAIAFLILAALLTSSCNNWDGLDRSDWQRQTEVVLYENGQLP